MFFKKLRSKVDRHEKCIDSLSRKIHFLQEGLNGAQNQLSHIYRMLCEHSSLIITTDEEEKNGYVNNGFLVVGENVFECFSHSLTGYKTDQKRFFFLKKIQSETDAGS